MLVPLTIPYYMDSWRMENMTIHLLIAPIWNLYVVDIPRGDKSPPHRI